MEPSELQSTLKAGIAAVRQGDRPGGRALLLRVVEADDRVEPAWLWLSAAVDDPVDQLTALENVLAINPGHAQALAGARKLREQLGLVSPPVEAAPPAATAETEQPDKPLTHKLLPADPEDDPYQCAYCGRQTEAEDTRCSHCRRGLLASGLRRGAGNLYVILIVAGLQAQLAVLQAVGVYGAEQFPSFASLLPGQPIWAANLLVPAMLRAFLWLMALFALLGEARYSFRLALGIAAADLTWIAAGFALGPVGRELSVLNAVMSGFAGLVSLAAVLSEFQGRVRLRVVLDKNLHSADLFARHAQAYAREGKWALAALHWRRAIALRPREPLYYKSLGHANVHLSRKEAALRAWSSGAEVAPADPDFAHLVARHMA